MGRMAACRWASDRLTKIIGHARSLVPGEGFWTGSSTLPHLHQTSLARPDGLMTSPPLIRDPAGASDVPAERQSNEGVFESMLGPIG